MDKANFCSGLCSGMNSARLQNSASLYPPENQVDMGLEISVEKDVWSQLAAESLI